MDRNAHILSVSLSLLLAAILGGPTLANNSPAPGFQMAAPTPATLQTPWPCFLGALQPRGGAGSELEITPDIQALARALDNDPLKYTSMFATTSNIPR